MSVPWSSTVTPRPGAGSPHGAGAPPAPSPRCPSAEIPILTQGHAIGCWDSAGTGDSTGGGTSARGVGTTVPTCCRELNPRPRGCSPQGPPESSAVAAVVLRLLWGPFPPPPPTAAARSTARRPGELPARMKAASYRAPTAPTARDGPRGAALRFADGDGVVRSPGKSAQSFGLSVSPRCGRLPALRQGRRGSGGVGEG